MTKSQALGSKIYSDLGGRTFGELSRDAIGAIGTYSYPFILAMLGFGALYYISTPKVSALVYEH
jgi:hypothetical protein